MKNGARRYVLGIDAGGTKTVGLLADEDGNVCAEARGGGANLQAHGELGVEKSLYQVIDALRVSGVSGPIAAACLGIAGVDRPGEEQLIRELLERLGLRRSVRIVNDALIALVAGAPGRKGIVVVAGTGSVAYGVDDSGRSARSGGWGYLLGDEGSGFWLGHAALRQGIRAADGRGPATTMYDRIAQTLDLKAPLELVPWFYDDQELSRYRVAQLASLVEEASDDGDQAADELLDQAAQHLARAARAVARQVSFAEPYPLVLAGGAFRACPSLSRRIDACLDLPDARVSRLEVAPATGAVTLALDLL